MNNIFSKNLVSLKDSEIKNKLESYEYNHKPILLNTNGYNIQYEETLIHNEQNPLAESMGVLKQANNKNDVFHIVYGLGLGYLFQLAVKNLKGMILLYEPNLDMLHNSFTLVDFSNELVQKNVFIFTEFDKLLYFIVENTRKETNVEILSLDSYRQMFKGIFEEQAKKLELCFGSVILDYGFKKNGLYRATYNVLRNIPYLINEVPINKFDNIYEGQTAIIVSAGPTLLENIETLKKYNENSVIFCVGPALKALIKAGIKVDFLCVIEAKNCSKQLEGLDLSEINLILEPYTHNAIHSLKTKNKLLHISSNMPPGQYFADIVGVDTKNNLARGTVSFMALNSAINMGFKKIVLVGQDLSYIEGQCYSKDSAYEDLICQYNSETNKYEITAKDLDKFASVISVNKEETVRIKSAKQRLLSLNSSLYTVKGVNGKMLPTEAGYASFIQHFEEYVKGFNDIEFINTSMKGALIEGFKNISLEDTLKNSKKIPKIELDTTYDYNLEKIYNKLTNLSKNLKESMDISQECVKAASRLSLECKRNKTVDKDKLLKIRNLIERYTILNDYTRNDNLVFIYITTEEEAVLNDCLKSVSVYNEETTLNVVKHLQDYYNSIQTRIEKIQKVLNYVLTQIEDVK